VLGLETQTKPLYRLHIILDRLEEGCELVLALTIAPDICEVMCEAAMCCEACDVYKTWYKMGRNMKHVPR
jgi:hypothetical protein